MGDLETAAEYGLLPRVHYLLPLTLSTERRIAALVKAAENNRLEVLRFMLESGVAPEDDSCMNSWYPLHAAVQQDNVAALALLLKAGAQPNVLDFLDCTPLYFAQSGPIVRLLLDAGADIHEGDAGILLHTIVKNGHASALREILTHPDVNVDARHPEYTQTPLHFAAMKKGDESAECVEALLAAGADACAFDAFGKTPLALLGHDEDLVDLYPRWPSRYRAAALLVAAGDYQWAYVPMPCPGLENALVPVWEKAPEELGPLFQRLEPAVQVWLREALRALHHGSRPVKGMDDPLRIKILLMSLESYD